MRFRKRRDGGAGEEADPGKRALGSDAPPDPDHEPDIADESLAARGPVDARVGRGGVRRSRPIENE